MAIGWHWLLLSTDVCPWSSTAQYFKFSRVFSEARGLVHSDCSMVCSLLQARQQLFPDTALIVPTPALHPPPQPTTATCSRETGKRFPSVPSLTSFSCSAACLAASKGKRQMWRWMWSHTLRFPPLGGDQLPSCLFSVSPSAVSDTPSTCVSVLPVKQPQMEQCVGEGMLHFSTCCCYLHKKGKNPTLEFFFSFSYHGAKPTKVDKR